jgi:STE24 endopeptidase
MNGLLTAVLVLILAKGVVEFALAFLNRAHVIANRDRVPKAFVDAIDPATYAKSVEYTLAKIKLSQIETIYDGCILLVALLSGLLPWLYHRTTDSIGSSGWAMAGFLFGVGVLLSLPGLPLSWYAQFRLEQRFGFNTTTQKLWWIDRLKALLLTAAFGYPLLVLVLKLVGWAGDSWWIWAWGSVLAFQFLMLVLAPALIMPLFNKFTPLPAGSLRERLLELGRRTGFPAKNIQVMDGSKRSRHSNAFFTGFGRWRKIVLFDTLVQQLSESELEAVLAHEIGHYKKRHIPKMMLFSAASLFAAFYVISWLSRQEWFVSPFGFNQSEGVVPALLLFALLSGLLSFWFSPLLHLWSRRYEYEADRYAAETTGEISAMCGALRKLNEKNLSNLTPHPAYSAFYYSHPTLIERERALKQLPLAKRELELAT